MIRASVFDERVNLLGEGPTATGVANEQISWVDIMGRKVRSRNFLTGEIMEYATQEDVGFAIPRVTGGAILGVVSGPVLRDADGSLHQLPSREDADGFPARRPIRWNDGKVSPQGDLFMGTMPYDFAANGGAFYQLRGDGKHIRRLFGDVTVSNGLDWTVDGSRMFYIDTALGGVDIFDVEGHDIRNRRTLIHFPKEMGSPDGMSVDANDNLWVAFWLGAAVRCFDGRTGIQIEEITCPAPRITSCVFGGEKLDQIFITSAREDTDLAQYPEAGMVFMASPGVVGQKTTHFRI
ncbi:MAG: SMP-30/gluconolactonase/LRE family protein [Actinobacteria bacterium]|nr:SMP-30/gluconolactonase/LRE family protein [Actinomycetota bacterium]